MKKISLDQAEKEEAQKARRGTINPRRPRKLYLKEFDRPRVRDNPPSLSSALKAMEALEAGSVRSLADGLMWAEYEFRRLSEEDKERWRVARAAKQHPDLWAAARSRRAYRDKRTRFMLGFTLPIGFRGSGTHAQLEAPYRHRMFYDFVMFIGDRVYTIRKGVLTDEERARLTRIYRENRGRWKNSDLVIHIGVLVEFGHSFDPPEHYTTNELAQKFRIPRRRVTELRRQFRNLAGYTKGKKTG